MARIRARRRAHGSASSSSRTPVRRPSEQAVFVPPPDVREEPVLAPAPKPAPAPPVTPPSNPTPAPDLEPEMVQDALSFPAPKRSHSPPEAHEAVTPPLDASAPAVTVVVPDQAQPNQDPNSQSPSLPLKRASPTADEEDEARKRARVEEPVVKTETEAEVKMEVDDSLGGAGQGGGAAGEEDEEEEDGFIEVGPDGLRTVRDCVDAVFDADEGYVCLFCKARYDADALKGVESAAPQGMGGASMEELAQHCEVEHAFAWNLLRTNVNPRSSESQ
ncbi:hypothetical protein C8R46DRAFT_251036 [Mycena filopes]|nr:hypothetical protein C8R46DRAFT_251036 [Mycena filopes]